MSDDGAESKSWVPHSLLRFYAKFPLVLLPAEEAVDRPTTPELWVRIPLPWPVQRIYSRQARPAADQAAMELV